MSRFFVPLRFASLRDIDPESSDLNHLVAIHPDAAEFEIVRTVFDFSIDIVDPHRANNRIHTVFLRKPSIDGFIANMLRPCRHCREVTEEEYQQFQAALRAKSERLAKKRRRKQVVIEERESNSQRLP